jgi:ribosomal protein S27AE
MTGDDRVKQAARRATRLMVRRGEVRPGPDACERCGRGVRLVCHHRNYADPAAIDWLCVKCHHAEHAALRETERAARHRELMDSWPDGEPCLMEQLRALP